VRDILIPRCLGGQRGRIVKVAWLLLDFTLDYLRVEFVMATMLGVYHLFFFFFGCFLGSSGPLIIELLGSCIDSMNNLRLCQRY